MPELRKPLPLQPGLRILEKIKKWHEKPRLNNKANDTYHKSYVAMVEGNESEYEVRCASFYEIIDNNTLNETVATETYIVRYENLGNTGLDIKNRNDDSPSLESNHENYWASLQVNTADMDSMLLPKEGVYEPPQIWERPAGHAVKGVDAFKLRCDVNTLRELAVTVIGDSRAAPTLISDKFLKSLMASKPKPRTGNKLKLLQLTGSAECSEYVKLDLYFRSQLGPVRLKGVKAYVVKGMDMNLLIGKDTQLAWQLHTI